MSKISFLIFHNFVKKISSKWSVKTFVSIVIFLVKMAPKNEKIKENPPRKGKWKWTIKFDKILMSHDTNQPYSSQKIE